MTALPLSNPPTRYSPAIPTLGRLPDDRRAVRPSPRVPRDALRASYAELSRLTRDVIAVDRAVDPRALVNEAARGVLGNSGVQELPSAADYFAYMANAARRLLRDRLEERGPSAAEMRLSSPLLPERVDTWALLGALDELDERHTRCAQAAVLALFGGLSDAEVAEQLCVTSERAGALVRGACRWLSVRLARPHPARAAC